MSRRRYKSKNSQQPQQPASTIGTCFASAASSPFGASTGFGQSTAAALAPGALFGTAATSFGGAPAPPTGFGGAPTPPAGFGGAPAPPASAADHKYRLQLFYQQRDPTKMLQLWRRFCPNDGDELHLDDVGKALEEFGELRLDGANLDDAEHLFVLMDVDGSGGVSFEEFEQVVEEFLLVACAISEVRS